MTGQATHIRDYVGDVVLTLTTSRHSSIYRVQYARRHTVNGAIRYRTLDTYMAWDLAGALGVYRRYVRMALRGDVPPGSDMS